MPAIQKETLTMNPIGYVVLYHMRDTNTHEPAALTRASDGSRDLLARSCFTMFPTEGDAIAAVGASENLESARVCAVFPAGMAAPHKKAETAEAAAKGRGDG